MDVVFKFIKKYFSIILIFFIGLFVLTIIFSVIYNIRKEQIFAEFQRDSNMIDWYVEDQIQVNLIAIENLAGLYISSNYVSRDEFKNFATLLLKRFPGIQALEWVPLVTQKERGKYVQEARKYYPDFDIMIRAKQGKMVSSPIKAEYFPVYYVEPYQGNEISLGFDLASGPERLETLTAARNSGEMKVTSRIILVQEKEKQQYGFLVFIPIYQKGTDLSSIQERKGKLLGFVSGVYRIKTIMELGLFAHDSGVAAMITDLSEQEEKNFLYCYQCDMALFQKCNNPPGLHLDYNIKVADRTWRLHCFDRPGYYKIHTGLIFILVYGIGISFLLCLSIYLLKIQKNKKQLSDSENRFRQLVENMSSGVAVYQAVDNGNDFIFKNFNKAGERIEKMDRSQVIGISILKCFPVVKEFGLFEVLQRVYKTGIPEAFPVAWYEDQRVKGWRENYVYKLPSGEVVAVYDDVTEKKIAEMRLNQSLEEKEILLREIHHRVKNNLQVIIGFFQLESKQGCNKQYLDLLKDSENRVRAMAAIYEKLYKSEGLVFINGRYYISDFVNLVINSFGDDGHVRLEVDIDPKVKLNLDQAIPVGLIINELVTNTLKYAFPDKKTDAKIMIKLKMLEDGSAQLVVADNGVGLPSGFDWQKTKTLGLKLVNMLTKQLSGEITIKSEPGVICEIIFKLR